MTALVPFSDAAGAVILYDFHECLSLRCVAIRILVRLQRSGPTTSEKLASEFSLPLGSVRFALAKLRDEKKMVRKLPFGFWDLPAEEEAA